MSFERSAGVIEAEARTTINRNADDTLAKMIAMGASPTEMYAANTIAKHVTEIISHGVALCQIQGGLDPVRIHQLVLYIAARAEQAVTAATTKPNN